jgi:hypothetical protein
VIIPQQEGTRVRRTVTSACSRGAKHQTRIQTSPLSLPLSRSEGFQPSALTASCEAAKRTRHSLLSICGIIAQVKRLAWVPAPPAQRSRVPIGQ